jgi:hypothetical protein
MKKRFMTIFAVMTLLLALSISANPVKLQLQIGPIHTDELPSVY